MAHKLESRRFTLPTEWATALVNGDYSGLDFYTPDSAKECRKVYVRLLAHGWVCADIDTNSVDQVRGTARYTFLRTKALIRFSRRECELMGRWHGGQPSETYAALSKGYVPAEFYTDGQPDHNTNADVLFWLWKELNNARECAVRWSEPDWRALARLCARVWAAREREVSAAENAPQC